MQKKSKVVIIKKPVAPPEKKVAPPALSVSSVLPVSAQKPAGICLAEPRQKKKKDKKTAVKRIGVKSIFVHQNELDVTSFGKGNAAELEMRATPDGSAVFLDPSRFRAKINPKNIMFSKRIGNPGDVEHAVGNNPAVAGDPSAPEDYLRFKAFYEKKYFDKTFPDDNIRIQIIYNMLDIRKIFGLYVNNIVFTVNNLLRGEGGASDAEKSDLIGTLTITETDFSELEQFVKKKKAQRETEPGLKQNAKEKSYDAFIEGHKKLEPYFSYFGDAFKTCGKGGKDEKKTRAQLEYNYNVVRVLSYVRNAAVHDKYGDFLFELDKKFPADEDLHQIIFDNYKARAERINKGFTDNAKINLTVLFRALAVPESDEQCRAALCAEYYRFAIFKDGKNVGVNLKKLREAMFDLYFRSVKNKEYDTFRQKIYQVADFMIYRFMISAKKITDGLIGMLRAAPSGDEYKDRIYADYAAKVWTELGKKIEMLPELIQTAVKEKTIKEFPAEWIKTEQEAIQVSDDFGCLAAYLCNFLEGKEINEFLSAYINKLENIRSLMRVLQDLGDNVGLKPHYAKFFAIGQTDPNGAIHNPGNLDRVIDEIRLIHSVGKMKPDLENAKKQLYKDAVCALGVKDGEMPDDAWFDKLNEPNKSKFEKNPMHRFRNFIANNVIESARFRYIVRYTNPKTTASLFRNKAVIHFILSRLPETQIERYFLFSQGGAAAFRYTLAQKIDMLAGELHEFSFAKMQQAQTAIENLKAEKLKGMIGLYLSVAYILVKNMVKANADYLIAWQCFERDYSVLNKQFGNGKFPLHDMEPVFKTHGFAITEHFLSQPIKIPEQEIPDDKKGDIIGYLKQKSKERGDHFKPKWQKILAANLQEAKALSKDAEYISGYIHGYRNQIVHLNVVSQFHRFLPELKSTDAELSYYDIFNYALQRILCTDEKSPQGIKDYDAVIKRYGTPSKDLAKIANLAFAYNLARYKNLSVKELFDKDSRK